MREPTFPYLASTTHPGFLNAPHQRAGAAWTVAGVAWDGATTHRPGARLGPAAIRRASHFLCDGMHPLWEVSPQPHLQDLGDLALPNTSLAGMRAALAARADAVLAEHAHVVWLGGDHSITLPILQAHHRRVGRPLALLHFDAHCDTWSDHFGEPSGHGTWLYEAVEQGLVDPRAVVQVGIRSPAPPAARRYIGERGGWTVTARELRGLESPDQLAGVVAEVRRRLGTDAPLYLSLDIDCLDPSEAPGTGTPEPAGLTTRQVATLLEELATLPFIGMDIVEVAPPFDHAELTSLAASHLVWTYLCGRVVASGGAGASG